MKITTILILSLLLPCSSSFSQTPADSLTLSQIIRLAIERNPSLAQTSHAIESAQAGVELARVGYYPDAKAEASYTRVGPVAQIDFPGAGVFFLNPANNYDAHVSVTQKIYDFEKTAKGINDASSRVDLASDRRDIATRDLAYTIARSFYTVLLLNQSILVQDQQIHALNEYLQVAQKKLSAGSATEFDVLTTRVRIAAAENQSIDLRNRFRQEQILLRRLADLRPDYPLNLSGSFQHETFVTNPDTLMDVAQRERVDLRAANDAVKSARMQVEVAGANASPSLNLNLEYGVRNGFIPNLDVLRGNYAAGVSLDIPIFNGYKTQDMEQAAQANLLAAEERQREAETQIRSDIQQALSNLNAASDKLQTTKVTVEQARRAVELARIRYDSGTITNIDLLDAETALDQARLNDLQALSGYVLSGYELKRAIGERIW